MHLARMFVCAILLLLAAASSLTHAQEPSKPVVKSLSLGSAIPLNPALRTGTLPNGLRYFILKNGKPENRAELRLAVNAGAVQETDEQRGLAHFCEHMAFNGTKRFKKDELIRYLESIGTRFGNDLNAYTSFDETVYMLQIPTDKPGLLDKGLDVLEDWAHNVSFEDAEIDKERGVILEELRLGKGAGKRIMDKQFPVMFHNSKYADRLPIGKEEILKSFTYETLKSYYARWYRPDNMAVIAVGTFDVDEMQRKITERFGAIPKPSTPLDRAVVPVPDHAEVLYSIVTDPEAPGTEVTVMSKRPPRVERKVMDLRTSMIISLYTTMFNARLDELRQKGDPPFLYGYGYTGRFARAKDALYLAAQVQNDGVETGFQTLLTEALRAQKHGFPASELERAKTSLLRRYEESYKERDKTPSERYASELVRHVLTEEPVPGIELEYELHKKYLPGITASEVNTYAASLRFDQNQVVTVSMPEKKDLRVPSRDDLEKVFAAVQKSTIDPYIDEVSNAPLVEVPASSTTITETSEVKEVGLTVWKLSNGVRVVIKPTDFKNDEILFAAYSPGGLSLVHDSVYMSGSQAADIVNESGLGDLDAVQLTKRLTGKIANVSPSLSELEEGFRGNAAPQDLEIMMQMLYMYFMSPRKDTTAFRSMMTRMKTMYESMMAYPEYTFVDSVTALITKGHLRGRMMNPKRLEEVKLESAFRQYQERFADASDFTMFFVGNITPEALKPLALKYIGALPVTHRVENWKDVGPRMPEEKLEKTVYKGLEKKCMVVMMFNGPFEWTYQNRYDLVSLQELLNIKLREEIREEKGGTYGVGVNARPMKTPRSEYVITIQFGCDPDRAEELMNTVYSVMKKVIDGGASAEDVQKIQEIQRREREKALKENSFWLERLKQDFWLGEDPAQVLKYETFVSGLSSKALQDAAAKYFTFDRMKKFVLMPEKK
ncbi:MAG: insulinase family protein [Ignavibacteriae bacterium]|nr:insulinase family protein [Ignavibacteriota bacterium]